MIWYVAISRWMRMAKPSSIIPSLSIHFSKTLTARLQMTFQQMLSSKSRKSTAENLARIYILLAAFEFCGQLYSSPCSFTDFLLELVMGFKVIREPAHSNELHKGNTDIAYAKKQGDPHPRFLTGPLSLSLSRRLSVALRSGNGPFFSEAAADRTCLWCGRIC